MIQDRTNADQPLAEEPLAEELNSIKINAKHLSKGTTNVGTTLQTITNPDLHKYLPEILATHFIKCTKILGILKDDAN